MEKVVSSICRDDWKDLMATMSFTSPFGRLFRTTIKRRDSQLAWFAVVAGICLQCTNIGFFWSFSIFYSSLLEEFKASKEKTAWLGAIPYSLTFFLSPFVCWSTRNISLRLSLIIAAVFTGGSLLLTSLARSLDLMFFTFSLLYGIGSCMTFFTIVKSINLYFDRHLSIATGIVSGGTALLQIALIKLMIALLDNYGLHKTFQIYGAASFLICLVGSIFFHPTSYGTENSHVSASERSGINDYIGLVKNKVYCLWAAVQVVICLQYGVSTVHQVQFAIESGIHVNTARQFPFYSAIAASMGRFTAGFLFNIKSLDKVYAFQALLLATGLTSIIGSFSTNQYHLISFIWIFAAFDGCLQSSCVQTLRSLIGINKLSQGYSIVLSFSSITMIFGPPLVGLIVDITKSYKAFFYVAGVPLLVGFVMLFGLRCLKDFQSHEADLSIEKKFNMDDNTLLCDAKDKIDNKENINNETTLLQLVTNV